MMEIRINRMTVTEKQSSNGPVARFGFSLCHSGDPFMSVNGCALWKSKTGDGLEISSPRGEEYNGKRPFHVWFDSDKFKERIAQEAINEYQKAKSKQPEQKQDGRKDNGDDLPF